VIKWPVKLYVRFLRFLRFFQNKKKHDFLRFFELLHTFSRTVVSVDGVDTLNISLTTPASPRITYTRHRYSNSRLRQSSALVYFNFIPITIDCYSKTATDILFYLTLFRIVSNVVYHIWCESAFWHSRQ